MPIVSSGIAPIPALKKPVVAHKPNAEVVELTNALTGLPADGQTFLVANGKTAKGVALVAGKIAARLGFAIRTQNESENAVRIWKIALTTEQLVARDARKAKAKEAKAKKEAANLAALKAE